MCADYTYKWRCSSDPTSHLDSELAFLVRYSNELQIWGPRNDVLSTQRISSKDRYITSTNVRRPLNGIYFQLNVEIRNLSQLLKFGPSISVVSTPTFVFPKSFCSPFKLIIFRTDFEGNAFGICDHNVAGLVPFRDHTCLELVPICDHKW